MRIVSIGGGPAGLYFALLMKKAAPSCDITVFERNRPDDTFGWGVVFSNETLSHFEAADPESMARIRASFRHWDDIETHYRGTVTTSTGHGFCGLSRKTLLQILQDRCRDLGVAMEFQREVAEADIDAIARGADLVLGADGVNSAVRARYAEHFRPSIDWRRCKFCWLGADLPLRAFTFLFEETEHGVFQVHAYPFEEGRSTFIVECREETWRRAGLEGATEEETVQFCERLFAKHLARLGGGTSGLEPGKHRLLTNRSVWRTFPTISNERWHHENVVLLGDAAHTAHFSIGSGTKLAMEDAIALVETFRQLGATDVPRVLAAYEEARRGEVIRLQRAAQTSLEWFESSARYMGQEPELFTFNLMTRSKRITYDSLAKRDPELVRRATEVFAAKAGVRLPAGSAGRREDGASSPGEGIRAGGTPPPAFGGGAGAPPAAFVGGAAPSPAFEGGRGAPAPAPGAAVGAPSPVLASGAAPSPASEGSAGASPLAFGGGRGAPPPAFTPFELRGLRLENRIVVSPMCQYSAEGGTPNDWHLVHLGSRAVGGAGLVIAEMTDVSPEGRISHGCAGLWSDEQEAAWRRIVDFVHGRTRAKIGIQLAHAGRKASMTRPWEGDRPLGPDEGAWETIGPSALPWAPGYPVPREMTRGDMDRVRDAFAAAARRAHAAGFDLVELHMAHGYLLSSFLSPLANHRTDAYGGSLENRARFPLEVLEAVRAAWPADKPISVRISATDWVPEGGFTPDEAVALARLLKERGCDIVDVSSGGNSPASKPQYGRMYQVPFAERIRYEARIPTMAVGAILGVDHANTVLAAERADLCALARPHLADPYLAIRAAARYGSDEPPWPPQYLRGKPKPGAEPFF